MFVFRQHKRDIHLVDSRTRALYFSSYSLCSFPRRASSALKVQLLASAGVDFSPLLYSLGGAGRPICGPRVRRTTIGRLNDPPL